MQVVDILVAALSLAADMIVVAAFAIHIGAAALLDWLLKIDAQLQGQEPAYSHSLTNMPQ